MRTTTLRNLRPLLYNNPPPLHQPQFPLETSSRKPRPFSTMPARQDLNPPASTLPPALEFPPPDPKDSKFRSLLKNAKAYYTFYRTGAKAVFSNFSASMPIQKLLKQKYGLHQQSFSNAVNDGFLNRSQFQLLRRSWHDILRIPLFGVVFIVFGEWTPAIVLMIPGVVPLTCRIPKQVEKETRQVEERRRKSFEELEKQQQEQGRSDEDGNSLLTSDQKVTYKNLTRPQLLHINASLNLSTSLWDYIGGIPSPFLKRKIQRKLEYLTQDDMLIIKEGGADAIADEKLSIEEIKLSLTERGIDVQGRDEGDLKIALKTWFHARKDQGRSIEGLLLLSKSKWDLEMEKGKEKEKEKSVLSSRV